MDLAKVRAELKKLSAALSDRERAQWNAVSAKSSIGQKWQGVKLMNNDLSLHKILKNEKLTDLKPDAEKTDFLQTNLRRSLHAIGHAKAVTTGDVRAKNWRTVKTYPAWIKARKKNDFKHVKKPFRRMIETLRDMGRKKAEAFDLADAYAGLLHEYEPMHATPKFRELVDDVTTWLPELRKKAVDHYEKPRNEPNWALDEKTQKALCLKILEKMGLDMDTTHLGETEHPLCIGRRGEVHIGMRYDEDDFVSAIISTVHEGGHALYRQNMPDEWVDFPAGGVPSSAVDEAMALIVERNAGFGKGFAAFVIDTLEKEFGISRTGLSADALHKKINRITDTNLRTDADETTYPLHVALRYKLAEQLVNGTLDPDDLPSEWHEEERKLLGKQSLNDNEGCLQDFHWYAGLFGYFPSYLSGAVMAAQVYEAAVAEDPSIAWSTDNFDCAPLVNWLRDNIYADASRMDANELMVKVTGSEISTDALRRRLESRYLPEPAKTLEQGLAETGETREKAPEPEKPKFGKRFMNTVKAPGKWLSKQFRKSSDNDDAKPGAPANDDAPDRQRATPKRRRKGPGI